LPLVVRTVGPSAVDGLRRCVVGVLGESCLDHSGVAERSLCGGAGVTVPGVDQVFQGSSDEAGGQVELVGDVLGAVLPMVGGLRGDDPDGFECGFGRGQVGEPFVDE